MNKQKITSLIGMATAAALVASFAIPFVSAQTNINTSASINTTIPSRSASELKVEAELHGPSPTAIHASGTDRTKIETNHGSTTIATLIARADKEIIQRIADLTKLTTRVQAMKRVSDANKTTILASIQSQISVLNTLKAKINADTDVTVAKTDVASITKSLRIYALVMPQIEILASADRLMEIGAEMTTIGTKLQTRITVLQTAGKDVASLQAALTDYTAKIADANTQGQAAITATASLTPDNGDATIAASNKTALAGARAQIKVGTNDLKLARKDADTILKGLKSFEKTLKPKSTSEEHTATGTNPSTTSQ